MSRSRWLITTDETQGQRVNTLLIGDLLLLSKVEEGAQPASLRTVNLGGITTDTVAMHVPMAQAQQLRITSQLPTAPVVILGDVHELERVISNLLSNAIKFSPPETEVTVTLSATASTASLVVSGQGIGISANDQQQLFTKFFRSSNPTAHAIPGTGLGLTISKLIVEKHRGTVLVDSDIGRGTTFPIHLPVAGPRQNEDYRLPSSAPLVT